MFEVQNYLKNWIGKIVVCEVNDEIFPHWKTEREKYIYDGTITNQNMRQLLPHEIIIEFDIFPGCEAKDKDVREEAVHWITLIKNKLDEFKVGYHITDHMGKCPHLRLQIEGLENEEPEVRAKYKLDFVKSLLESIHFKSNIVKLDKGFFGRHPMVIPLENALHWKNKYHTREIVIEHNSNSYMRVRQDMVEKVKKTLYCTSMKNSNHTSFSASVGLNIPLLTEVFKKHYLEGQRHYILAGLTRMFKYRRYDLSQIKDVLLHLTKLSGNSQEMYKDLKDIEMNYIESTFHPVNMFKLAYGDYESARECMNEFESCFLKIGDDL